MARSYFDRWLDPRTGNEPPVKGLRPEWSLGAGDKGDRETAKALTDTGKRVLRRISENKLPYGLRVWPDEEGVRCPSLP